MARRFSGIGDDTVFSVDVLPTLRHRGCELIQEVSQRSDNVSGFVMYGCTLLHGHAFSTNLYRFFNEKGKFARH